MYIRTSHDGSHPYFHKHVSSKAVSLFSVTTHRAFSADQKKWHFVMGGDGLGARLARLPAIGLFTSFFSASLFGLCNVIVKGVSDTLYLGGNHKKNIDAGGKCRSVHNRLLQIHRHRTSRLLDPYFQKPSRCLYSDCFCPLIMQWITFWISTLCSSHPGTSLQDPFPKGKVWMLVVRSVMGASNLCVHFYGVKHMPIGVN